MLFRSDKGWTFKTTGAGGEDAIFIIGPKNYLPKICRAIEDQGWRLFEGSWPESGSSVELVETELRDFDW